MKAKKIFAVILAAAMLLILSGCGGGEAPVNEDFTLTVANKTGITIYDLRVSEEDASEWGDNGAYEPFLDGETMSLNLGEIAQSGEEASLAIQIFDEYDETIGVLHYVGVFSGNYIALYLDNGELCFSYSEDDYYGTEEPSDPGEGILSFNKYGDFNPAEGDSGGAPDPNNPVYGEDEFSAIQGTWTVEGDTSGAEFTFDAEGGWTYYVNGSLSDYGYVTVSADSDSWFDMTSEADDSKYGLFSFDTDLINFYAETGESFNLERKYQSGN